MAASGGGGGGGVSTNYIVHNNGPPPPNHADKHPNLLLAQSRFLTFTPSFGPSIHFDGTI